jgi:hypothetical protein
MFTATLVYSIDTGFQFAANYVAAVQAIDLFEPPPPAQGVLTLLGMDLVSDVTAQAGVNLVTRTIVLSTNAQGDGMYSDADAVKAATRNLFKAALNLRLPGRVAAAEPVVT